MKPDPDGCPAVGRAARMLGVRVPGDIAPDAEGLVRPNTGGMSVSPGSIWNVPNHRRPMGMGRGSTGPGGDRIFAIGAPPLATARLTVRAAPDRPELHAFVEPGSPIPLAAYDGALSSTRPDWSCAWP